METPWRKRAYDLLRLNFALFPGVAHYRAAGFIGPYYEAIRARQNWLICLRNLIVFIGFQLWLPWRTLEVAKRWSKGDCWRRRTLAICRERFVDPNDIAMFRIEEASELDHYIRRFEHIGIGRAIANQSTDHSIFTTDKRAFYDHCAERQIPHPAVFATIDDGEIDVISLPNSGDAVLIKPACGSGGRGVQIPARKSPDFASSNSFVDWLGQLNTIRSGQWIAQRHLVAHPDLSDLAINALPSVRVTTILNESGEPEIVTTVLRFPKTAEMVIDNIGKGGLNAPVELETGRLGRCCAGMEPGEYERHPESGAQIEGRLVPHWAKLKELALTTHANHFADHVMIGWDVAISAEGPLFLEANPRPSIIMAQRAPRLPAGKQRLGELIGYHLKMRQDFGQDKRRLLRAQPHDQF
ncbi:sugar-transfer associated ATP-grasp domain-containing protein [Qipengyuania sp.]|uniref:sugar-transfer associated ATP-grasp domain-containing protein n=1 Tax=Qipengyuania sp. TaxID=2004515 RepID=UPI003BAABB12